MNNKIIALMVVSILLTSCGGVTPVPTMVTATPQRVTPTPTIESTPQVPPTEAVTLPRVAKDYRLKPWDVNDSYYADLIEKFSEGTYDINSSRQRYSRVFKAEKILRDPSQDWRELAWQIVADYPNGIALPGMRPNEDLLSYLIEDALNNRGVTLDGLFDLLEEKIQSFDGCIGTDFDDDSLILPDDRYLKIPNLFGDGETALVFYASQSCVRSAVYVLRGLNGVYQVEKIKDWQDLAIPAAGYYLKLFSVGDTNGNRIPEIVIETYFGASGDPQHWSQKLDWYEWDSTKSVFTTDDVSVFRQGCDKGPCRGDWTFGPLNAQGMRPLITDEYYFTEYDLYKSPSEACPDLDIQSIYLWNGSRFAKQSEQIQQSTSNLPECQVLWAYRALELGNGVNDEAINTLARGVENWPSSIDVIFGPASRDYFSLKLGVWYDQQGENERSTRVLQGLVENPFNSDYDFVSRLAETYLDVRSKDGIVQACDEVEYLKGQSLNEIAPYPYVYLPIDKLIDDWGFGYEGWYRRTDMFCDSIAAMGTVARQVSFMDIDQWLSLAGITPKTVQEVDIDLPIAWLVEIPYKSFSTRYDANTDKFLAEETISVRWWLLVKATDSVTVIYLFSGDADSNLVPSVEQLILSETEQLLLIKYNDEVLVYYIDADGRLISVSDDLYGEVYVSNRQIVMLENDYFSDTKNIYAYTWNSEKQSLESRMLNYDFDVVQGQIENTIFRDQNYSSAIALINIFFAQAPSEPIVESSCAPSGCDYYPEWYRPYMRYLLALSYEMSGQTDKARNTYFALWQDYPEHVFGLAAEHRLISVTP